MARHRSSFVRGAGTLFCVCSRLCVAVFRAGEGINGLLQLFFVPAVVSLTLPPGQLRHVCPAGCCGAEACGDRATSVDRACDLIYAVVLRNLQIPALNKWTKLAPVLSQITLMANFVGVIARAFGSKLEDTKSAEASGQVDPSASGQVDPEGADMSEGEILGAPSDSAAAFRKAAQRRTNKGYRFLSHPGTPGTLLVWMVISDIVMPIHYRLFKYATFFSHSKDTRCGMFEYGGNDSGHRSPAVKALVDMANIVLDPSASGLVHLGPLTALYGMRVDQWPWRVRMQLQVALVLASSCLWRKLRRSLQCFPWLLVPLCDDKASEADQQAAAKRLFDSPPCCLDPGLGRRLRNSVDSWECLRQEPLRTFLKVFFQRAVVTSTFVERCFAALTRFSKPPQSCATLAAKHTNATFAQIVEQWRASQGVCAREQTRARPAWMRTSVRGFKKMDITFLPVK